ncbi:metallophosphoesterase [Intestinimonas timonensis]|uniref:metallophosphoesterase n=1 Tax=Intestinimonas timonensis TaxID=1689270 RepID=UPI003A8DAAF5
MIYACSDLHGHYDRWTALLEKIGLRPADTLYVLGDVIDRGPDGCKILLDMMGRPNVLPILGNHEFTAAVCLPWLLEEVTDRSLADLDGARLAALQEWIANGGGPTLRGLQKLSRAEREDILDYLREMELYAEAEAGGRSFVLTHAGLDHFSPEKPLEDYELEDFLFCRPKPNEVFWPDRYLVYGHTPTRLLRAQMGKSLSDDILPCGQQIAIDCGCGFDGKLGCICLDTMEMFYVE